MSFRLYRSKNLFVSLNVVETITQEAKIARITGTQIKARNCALSSATLIPHKAKSTTGNMNTTTKRQAVSESYQGIIVFLCKGESSSCIPAQIM